MMSHDFCATTVYGPPGTGKTTYATRRANDLAEEVGAGRVLLTSLTKAAAEELASRDTPIPRGNVGTLHAHAYRALDAPQIAEDATSLQEWDQGHRWRLSKTRALDGPFDSGNDSMLDKLNVLRAQMVPADLWPTPVRRFASAWSEWKTETNRLDFTDLLAECLEHGVYPQCDPRAVIVDEAQDHSRLEMALVRMWCDRADHHLIVGDPWQALYGWRGGDAAAFTDDADPHVLGQSHRLPRAVQERATRWLSRTAPRGAPGTEYNARDAEGSVSGGPAMSRMESAHLASRMDRADGTTMALATCGYMLDPLLHEMRRRAELWHNPWRPTDGRWNPLNGAGRLRAFLRPDPDTYGDDAQPWNWRELATWLGPIKVRDLLVRGAKAKALAHAKDSNTGARLVGLDEIRDLFISEDSALAATCLDVRWLERLTPGKRPYAHEVYHRRGGAALLETPTKIVGTIHSVKGGEADHVFLAPDLSRKGYDAMGTRGGRAAITRQMYVGMTRARESLTLLTRSGPMAATW